MARVHRAQHRKERPPLPVEWKELRRATLGPEADALFEALDAPASVSIRVHPHRSGAPAGTPVPWCASGRYLEERPVFTLDPFLHAGAYYVQEASAMMLEPAMNALDLVGRNLLALDLCAAPGGKSTHLLDLLGPSALVVCNEVEGRRRQALQHNLWKWGSGRAVLTGSATERFARSAGRFDLVLVDAPCSGEGLMRREGIARSQWSPGLVRSCRTAQRDILRDAWACLRPGGALIYATCTFAPEEDEDQLQWAVEQLGAIPRTISYDPTWGTMERGHGLLSLPHRLQGEGSYFGALRKPGPTHGSDLGAGDRIEVQDGVANAWILGSHRDIVDALRRDVDVHLAGTPLFTTDRRGRQPHPAAAFDPIAADRMIATFDAVRCELDTADALRYLRGEALRDQAAKGWGLMSHQGQGLGWAKGVARRWNNHYPTGWRIRMHHQGA
ncbi:MAG: hypothetical protein H6595_02395 [Flavobacteriales bacterium]|nr:hypothetical protein [Flavobacteriales bacterium]MCB9166309.1 hypothetical protein [Flavobacteriales bacterium]